MCILCFLVPLLVGLVCAWLGYLLGKRTGSGEEELQQLRSDLERCREEKKALQTALDGAVEGHGAEPVQAVAGGELPAGGLPLAVPFDAALAAAVFGRSIRQDDLKVVEGIGPAIAEIFRGHGIDSWRALALTTPERCRRILAEAGERFRIHNPDTWPRQSELAFLGRWEELKAWQETLQGGRR